MIMHTQLAEIILEIENGATLTRALRTCGHTPKVFFDSIRANPVFQQLYNEAIANRAELHADEIMEIADNEEDIARAKLKITARQWIAAKDAPARFGERMEVKHTHTLDLSQALQEAEKRIIEGRMNDIKLEGHEFRVKEIVPPESIEEAVISEKEDPEELFK